MKKDLDWTILGALLLLVVPVIGTIEIIHNGQAWWLTLLFYSVCAISIPVLLIWVCPIRRGL